MPVAWNNLPEIAAGVGPKIEKAVRAAAFATQSVAQQSAPVDTGNLRGSIRAEAVSPIEYRVVASAEYSVYVELGTHKMAAQPFLDPALRRTFPILMRSLGRLLA